MPWRSPASAPGGMIVLWMTWWQHNRSHKSAVNQAHYSIGLRPGPYFKQDNFQPKPNFNSVAFAALPRRLERKEAQLVEESLRGSPGGRGSVEY